LNINDDLSFCFEETFIQNERKFLIIIFSYTVSLLLLVNFLIFSDTVSIKDCTSELTTTEQWKCLQPEYYYKHVYTPAFFIQSIHDSWYLSHALGIQCTTTNCKSATSDAIYKNQQKIVLALSQVLESKGDGLFASSCPFHWVLLKSTFYGDLNINGTTVRKAVGQWYFHRKNTPVHYIENEPLSKMENKCNNVH